MLLIVDNYDSFVTNIVHFLEFDSSRIWVARNDRIDLADIGRRGVKAIILSPGPMSPTEAGLCNEIIRTCSREIPILGICLGHQCIGHVFGCQVLRHPTPTHGKKSLVRLEDSPLYQGLGDSIQAARYHSLYVARDGFAHDQLVVNAQLEDGTIMGVQHRTRPVYGVQFHPESILTGEPGKAILRNFVTRIAHLA